MKIRPTLACTRHLVVIHNPTAGGRRLRRFEATVAALQALGATVSVLRTGRRGDAERFARDAGRDGTTPDAVVAAGGDGTINEVINGLMARDQPLPLGIVPLGTANVLAGELALPTDPRKVARILAEATPRPIHLGLAGTRHFAMMAGAGLDAEVVEHVDPRLKRLTGKGAYVIETLAQLLRNQRTRFRVAVQGRLIDVASVIVANGHFYGGRFVCAPTARLDAPELQVCLFPKSGRWNALRYTAAVVLGWIGKLPDYQIVSAQSLRIEEVQQNPGTRPVQGDGDIIGRLPLDISVARQPLMVLAP